MDINQLKEKVNQLLNKEIDLHEFERWFVPVSWDIEQGDAGWRLCGRISLTFAEYSVDHRTYEDLEEELKCIITDQI